ncbi:MAG: sialate O-acetylesterase [Cellulosilyticaceae bacterium]
MLNQNELKDKKYVILCVAGQSNAVGYDESIVDSYYTDLENERIMQLGLYEEDNLNIIPLGTCAQNYQDLRPYSHPENDKQNRGTKGVHLPLGNLLLKYLPSEYNLLVIPAAYGGTGFTVGAEGTYDEMNLKPAEGMWRWGMQSPYYKGIKDRIAYALKLNEENKFLGMIWIQGEHDSADAEGQKVGFRSMTQDFFSYFNENYSSRVMQGGWNKDIWYNVETVNYWYGVGECQTIWDNYREWNPRTYVEIPRDTDSNEVNGTGLTASIRAAHYGNNAFLNVVAPRILEKILEN